MNRKEQLNQWLVEEKVLGTADYRVAPLAGDASFRSYHRVWVGEKSYVVMDAPPPESPKQFIDIAALLAREGLTVPAVLKAELGTGFLLLSDFGDRLYLNELNNETADSLYQIAFEALLKIQAIKTDLPSFDRSLLETQMGVFEEWYLQKNKSIRLSVSLKAILDPINEEIYQVIESQPQVLVHRDYHSRNLMILSKDSPGILDFQDTIIGPITYDLVSLLQDCYISWPRARVEKWVEAYREQAISNGLLSSSESSQTFLRWFDWTGLQRHLKNLGVFSRLNIRDNKPGYLKSIPQVLRYIFDTCERYPALKPLQTFLMALETEAV
jgi:aminoglycoside/choline kinase family phosphotransferase